MPKIVTAFGGTEALQAFPEERPERVDAATAGRADDRLQLGEAEFDGVKVGTVWRQIPQGRVGLLDGAADAGDLVHALRLSAMTMSPGCSVGTRICSM